MLEHQNLCKWTVALLATCLVSRVKSQRHALKFRLTVLMRFDVCVTTCRFSHCFNFLGSLPKEEHIWCGYADIMGPFLETFLGYFDDQEENSPPRTIWKRISEELNVCAQCVCEHHQAQKDFDSEYRFGVDALLKVLRLLDEERVTEHLRQMNAKAQLKEYKPSCHDAEVSIMFEVCIVYVILFSFPHIPQIKILNSF